MYEARGEGDEDEEKGAGVTGLDLNRRLLEALAERDTLKTELDRIAADKAYLFHANIANEWEERFESQERRLEMANEELAKVQAQAQADQARSVVK